MLALSPRARTRTSIAGCVCICFGVLMLVAHSYDPPIAPPPPTTVAPAPRTPVRHRRPRITAKKPQEEPQQQNTPSPQSNSGQTGPAQVESQVTQPVAAQAPSPRPIQQRPPAQPPQPTGVELRQHFTPYGTPGVVPTLPIYGPSAPVVWPPVAAQPGQGRKSRKHKNDQGVPQNQ